MIAISPDGKVRALETNDFAVNGDILIASRNGYSEENVNLAFYPSLSSQTTAFLVADRLVIPLFESDAIATVNQMLSESSPAAGIPDSPSSFPSPSKQNLSFDTEAPEVYDHTQVPMFVIEGYLNSSYYLSELMGFDTTGIQKTVTPEQIETLHTMLPMADVIDLDSTTNSVSENAKIGDTIGIQVGKSFEDGRGDITYSLTDDAGGLFAIDPVSGEITVAGNLDYETASNYTIEVTATYPDNQTKTEIFSISVTDKSPAEGDSDNAISGIDTLGAGVGTVNESAANGTSTGLVVFATDADGDKVTYSLLDDGDGAFTIDPNSGEVTVADSAKLDYESTTTKTIVVQATSTDGSTSTQTYSINLTDDTSEFSTSAISDADASANGVSESAVVGSSVGITAHANDGDGTDTVTYSLSNSAGGMFAIDPNTGEVTVAGALDYETATSHTITVVATSTDGSTSSQSYTVNLGDDSSEFSVSSVSDTNTAANTVSESALVGSSVGVTMSATDSDGTDSVAYSLTDDADGLFAINPTTGEVTVAGALDYETATSHTITVKATSTDGSTSTETITINVSDDTSEFSTSAVSDADVSANGVSESAAVGASVGITAHATDGDGTDTVTYSLSNSAGGLFAIDPNTGEVTVAGALDYETAASHTITVVATSTDGSTSSQSYTVNLSDDNSEFSVSSVSDTNTAANTVSESATVGSSIGVTMSATDSDGTDTVTYSLTDDAGGLFAINSTTGEVTVAGALDYETATSHTITVKATSSDGSSSIETITINVSDDTSEFSTSAVSDADAGANGVSESASVGDSVGITTHATDGDGTDTVTYSLSNSAGGLFTIDPNTGEVTVAGALDYETATSHTITVVATSTDGSTSSQSYTVNVGDNNTEYSITAVSDTDSGANSVTENAAVGTPVGITASASDSDGSDTITYSLSNSAGGLFAIDPSTGEVTVAGVLDYETATSHTITVVATSSDGTSTNQNYTISVLDQATDKALSINEDSAHVFTSAELVGASAVSGGEVKMTSLPADGVIEYFDGSSWGAVTSGQAITLADIDAGKLRYTPDANESGSDAYGTAGMGDQKEDYAAFDYELLNSSGRPLEDFTLTVDVVPVVDGTSINNASSGGSGNEDTAISIALPVVTQTDTDGSETVKLVFKNLPVGSVLSDGTNTFTATSSVRTVDITTWSAGALTFTPPLNYNGSLNLDLDVISTETATGSTTTQSVTLHVTVVAVDDLSQISGDTTGSVNEGDVGDTITATGTLTVSDVDGDPVTIPDGNQTGTYGSLSLVSGAWTYTVNNTAADSLDAGDTVTDTFTVTASDGSTETVTITLTGTNDGAQITGTTSGSVDLSGFTIDPDVGGSVSADGTPTSYGSNSAWISTTTTVDGVPYMVSMKWDYSGEVIVYRIENDGSMTEVERITYDNSAGTVISTSQGDITSAIVSAGYSVAALGNGLAQATVSDIDGQATLFLTSQNSGSVTAWALDKDGSLTFEGGLTEFGSSDGSVRDGRVTDTIDFESDDGTEYLYVSRLDVDRIDILTYDPLTGSTSVVGNVAASDEVFGLSVSTVGNTSFLASVSYDRVTIYSIDSSTGSLTYIDSQITNLVPPMGTSGIYSSSAEFYHTSDGRTYLIVSSSYSDISYMYEVAADGTLTLTDSLSDRGAHITAVNYIEDEPVFLAVNDSGEIDIFTISQSGEFVLQTTVAGSYNSKANPAIVETPDGSYHLIVGDGDVSSVKLDIGISSRLKTSGTLTISDVDQDDSPTFANTTIAGIYGTFTLTNGSWEYVLDREKAHTLPEGQTAQDDFTLTASDGSTQTISITVSGADIPQFNHLSVISGDTTGAVIEGDPGDVITATGTLTVADADGDAVTIPDGTYTGDYGSLSLVNGVWTYTVDNAAADSLDAWDTVVETFTIWASDNASQTITITLTGTDDGAQIAGTTTGSVDVDGFNIDPDSTGSVTVDSTTTDRGYNGAWLSTTTTVDGVPYLISMEWGTGGTTTIYRIGNDGSLIETDRITYNSSTGSVYSSSQGDITSDIQAAGYSTSALGHGLSQSSVSDIDGQATLFLTSEFSGSVTAWEIGSDGTLSFNGGITEYGGANETIRDGTVRDNAVYEADDGTEYMYVTRPEADRIDILTYDPATGTTTFVGSSSWASEEVYSLDIITIGGTAYLASAGYDRVTIYSIDSSDGSLNYVDSEVNNLVVAGYYDSTVQFCQTADGRTYVIVSGSSSSSTYLYEVDANGNLTLSDTVSGGVYQSSISYIDGEPVLILPNAGGGVDLYTISQGGDFVFQTTVTGVSTDFTQPTIVRTENGSYYLIDGEWNLSSVKLDFGTSSLLTTSGSITISDVDQDDAPTVPDATVEGQYGTLTLTNGNWVYELDRFKAQTVADGETAQDIITLTASDGSTHTITITVSGADIAPVAETHDVGEITDADVMQNLTGDKNSGYVFLKAQATDEDGDSVTYSLTDDHGGAFYINASTGEVYLINPSLVDASTNPQVTIEVTATSSDGSTSAKEFTIDVTAETDGNNISQLYDSDSNTNVISENAANGTYVNLDAQATAEGMATWIDNTYVAWHAHSGNTIQGLHAGGIPSGVTIDFYIGNTKIGSATSDGSSRIYFNSSSSWENVPNGSDVWGTVSYNGETSNIHYGYHFQDSTTNYQITKSVLSDAVTYSLIDDYNGAFQINTSTGQVTVRDASKLDYEIDPNPTVTIRAVTSSGSVSIKTFGIALQDDYVAVADSYSTTEDTKLTVNAASGLLSNDTGDTNKSIEIATDASGANAALVTSSSTFTTTLGGTVTINPDGSFDYIAPVLDHSSSATVDDSFYYRLGDGSWAQVTLSVADQNITANDDTDSVGTQGTIYGNVITDSGGTDSAASDAKITSVLYDGTTYFVSGATTIVGALGTLVINPDGSYTYQSSATGSGPFTNEVFTYTLGDDDGDTDTAALTISHDTSMTAVAEVVSVYESSLVYGSEYGNNLHYRVGNVLDNDMGITGDAQITDVVWGGVTYNPDANGIIDVMTDHGDFKLYTQDYGVHRAGEYQFILEHASDGTNETEVFTYSVSNATETVSSTVTVSIVDDPIISLVGFTGDDTLTGSAIDEVIVGGSGSDTLDGGGGLDTLVGGIGDDILTGGSGSDTFKFLHSDVEGQTGITVDHITDFDMSTDVLDLSDLLQDESEATLDSYLQFLDDGSGHAVLSVCSHGDGHVDQQIVFDSLSVADMAAAYSIDTTGRTDGEVSSMVITSMLIQAQLHVD